MKIEIYRHSEAKPWSYRDLALRQQAMRDSVLGGGEGTILFSEVRPVITLGFRKTSEDLLLAREDYISRGIEVVEVSRGGRATYHGPGQWVVFVVDSLERLTGDRKGVRNFVDALFTAALEVCQEKFPAAEIRDGKEAGVWSAAGASGAKLAAFGLQIDQGITQHGFSLNVFATKESFKGLRPCGLDAPVGFLEGGNHSAAESEQAFLSWREKLEVALRKRF